MIEQKQSAAASVSDAVSDQALMLAFQRGSRSAFEELFARYSGPIFGFFRRRIPDDARAQDLTQDTFLAVIRSIERYQPEALVRTYLYAIALNLVYVERRKRGFEPLESFTGSLALVPATDEILRVRQALQRLDHGDREILMLREYEQFSYEEIAEVLAIPLNTVRSRLFRARIALKNQLSPQEAA